MDRDSCLIVGTGALATLLAARLSAARIKVTILGSWRTALEIFQLRGAQIESERAYPINAISAPDSISPVYQSIVLVKSTNTDKAAKQLITCLDEEGCALTLQNGLGNQEKLSSILGTERVVSGVTTIGARLLSPGQVKTSGKSTIWIEKHSRIGKLVHIFRKSGFIITLVNDVRPYVWRKLVINCAINPITAILREKNGILLNNPPLWEVVEKIVNEAVLVSWAVNNHNYFTKPFELVRMVAEETSENHSSMLQDVIRGVPTEIEAINGEVIRLANFHEIHVPVNRLLYSLICESKHLSSTELVKLSKTA